MNFFKRSLSNRILGIIVAALIIITFASQFIIGKLSDSVDQYNQLISESVDYERTSSELVTLFKIQVQEWKNVLLRGHKQSDRDKYWGKFTDRHQEIQTKAVALQNRLPDGKAKQIIRDFIDTHSKLVAQYRQGYDAFVNSNFDPKVGDSAVRGIDRAPTDELREAANILAQTVKQNSQQATDRAESMVAIAIPSILIIAAILIGLLYFLLVHQFKRPIDALLTHIERFGQGDFSHPIKSTSIDELGRMRAQLSNAQEFLRGFMTQIKSASEQLSKNADLVNNTSATIAEGTESTTSRLEQTATAVTEMTSTVQEVAQNATGAATSASNADVSAQKGREVMQNTIATINALSQEVTSASNVIRKLEEDTSSVGTVLDVIRGIAEQTNLLALNAAIEAARAGEQGRGFAVVADEVRNLAQRTQESTAEIQQIIENVQTGAKDAVVAMVQGSESTAACVEQANAAGSSLDEITGAVNEIHMMNSQIATAAEEQTTVSEDISKNINEISTSTNEIHGNVRKFNQLSASLAEMAEEMNAITARVTV